MEVPATRQLLADQRTGCDYPFWIDIDCVIQDMAFRLEGLIGWDGGEPADVVLAEDTLVVNVVQSLWKANVFKLSSLEQVWGMGMSPRVRGAHVPLWGCGALAAVIAGGLPVSNWREKAGCYRRADRGWRDQTFSAKCGVLTAARFSEL